KLFLKINIILEKSFQTIQIVLFYYCEVKPMQKNINMLIKSYYDNLNGTSKDIADYLLKHPQTSSALTITDLARETNSSISSISRFAKKLGFNNFQELKINLLTSTNEKKEA